MRSKIIVVAGPTASGKTRLGIELARRYNGEIVSADSMQLYRGMDVGTAKATKAEQAQAVHHMIDVADPAESWSVARYVQEAGAVCDDILARGRIPILVGGTGLYIDSLAAGRDFADNQEDRSLRTALEADFDRLGGETMLQALAAFDPARAAKLNAGDRRRIVRAIEIYRLTGKTKSAFDKESKQFPPRFDCLTFGLDFPDRKTLYRRIDLRVDQMMQAGLYKEATKLWERGSLAPGTTAGQAIGYRQFLPCFEGEKTPEEAAEEIKLATRRYAKRQLTWFRAQPGIVWLDAGAPDLAERATEIASAWLNERSYFVGGQ